MSSAASCYAFQTDSADLAAESDGAAPASYSRDHAHIRSHIDRLLRLRTQKGACTLAQLRIALAELGRLLAQIGNLGALAGVPHNPLHAAPHLAYRIARLRGQHSALFQELESLAERSDSTEDELELEQVLRRILPLSRALDAHLSERACLIDELVAAGASGRLKRQLGTTDDNRQ